MLNSPVKIENLIYNSISILTINKIGLDQLVQQFWITEELSITTKATIVETECENYYKSQVTHESNGKSLLGPRN